MLAFGAPKLALRGLRASTAGAVGRPGCQRTPVSVESAEIGSAGAEHDLSNLAILAWCAARPRGGAHSRRGAYGRCRQLSATRLRPWFVSRHRVRAARRPGDGRERGRRAATNAGLCEF